MRRERKQNTPQTQIDNQMKNHGMRGGRKLFRDHGTWTILAAAGPLVGLSLGILSGFLLSVGGPINGPIVVGLCAVADFGALGKHPRNVLPMRFEGHLINFLPHVRASL
ncbi:MAG: DUF1576 domain-containing protein [Candidatus Ozemobacteraceae bacterium]